jgi:hypothetical protein
MDIPFFLSANKAPRHFVYILLSLMILHSRAGAQPKWIKLFNGKDLNEWVVKIYHHETGDNYQNTFRAEDGMLRVKYDGYKEFGDRFGHLFYKKPFSYFHLTLEYRLTGEWKTDAPSYTILNSGVMFHSQDPGTINIEQNWPISVEMQLYSGLGDGKPRPTCNMCSPGTDIFYEGQKYPGHCLNSSAATYPKEQWVKVELIVLGDSLITHVVEGKKVLQYSKTSIGGGVVSGQDTATFKEGKPLTSGFIALQSEGQEVDFRNIKICDLAELREKSTKRYYKYLKQLKEQGRL